MIPHTTFGKCIPTGAKTTDVGWGIVRLYRDSAESPALADDGDEEELYGDDSAVPAECTTLCILAVPSYMTPSDFLGFVGEQTREAVSHFRLIRTERANKYMALMKFRSAGEARRWQHEWNGRNFNSMDVSAAGSSSTLYTGTCTCSILGHAHALHWDTHARSLTRP